MIVTVFDKDSKERIYSGNPTQERLDAWEAAGHIVKPGMHKGNVKIGDTGDVIADVDKDARDEAVKQAKKDKNTARIASKAYLANLTSDDLLDAAGKIDKAALDIFIAHLIILH